MDIMSKKQAHLEMIQAIINRLSHNSFLLKGWTVLLISALFALAAHQSKPIFICLAYFPSVAFWCLDGFFLWQEKLYRALYDNVRGRDDNEVDFSMDTSIVRHEAGCWLGAVFSKTLLAFHFIILITIVFIMIFICFYGGNSNGA